MCTLADLYANVIKAGIHKSFAGSKAGMCEPWIVLYLAYVKHNLYTS